MKFKSKMQKMAAFIEFIVGAGLAIVFHLVLHDAVSAFLIFGVGLLLSLSTWLLREDIVEIREKLLDEYREFHEFPNAMRKIEDAECLRKAKEILVRVTRNLKLLQRGFIPLNETEFMLEATKAANMTKSTVKSVCPLVGWDMRRSVEKYYQSNKQALDRGVTITRLFILRRERYLEEDVQKILRAQHDDGIEVKVVYRDEIPRGEAGWSKHCSFNFEVFDDWLVLDASAPMPYYGVKTVQRPELTRYHQMFDLVDHVSHIMTFDMDEVEQP